ncbi:hypothetical protein [Oligosphaera ethanolica]|uniref:Uncharacterized protein n=1 Tax=Oligosphaera ethanolica TaxID=760260 RepID=A0AAE4ARB2_9BACT|nr:hypothetical protein [Oligosphaera ethanolica]MDQ0291312.1 hypothetical protein [Oligosphaera ethanolica]
MIVRTWTLCLALAGLFLAFALHAEDYRSEGISATMDGAGGIRAIAFRGRPVLDTIVPFAEARLAPDATAMVRLTPGALPSNTCVYEREGDTLLMRASGCLGNDEVTRAVDYTLEATFSPDAIAIEVTFVNVIDLYAQSDNYVKSRCYMPLGAFFDCGLKAVGMADVEQYLVIPDRYSKSFRGNGRRMQLWSDGVLLDLACSKSSWSLQDCRAWGENRMLLSIMPDGIWTWEYRHFPAGSKKEISFVWRASLPLD